MSASTEKQLTIQVSRVSIILNVLLCTMKFFAGIVAHSSAMVADAVHSASDVFGSFLVIIGANHNAAQNSYRTDFPYGQCVKLAADKSTQKRTKSPCDDNARCRSDRNGGLTP